MSFPGYLKKSSTSESERHWDEDKDTPPSLSCYFATPFHNIVTKEGTAIDDMFDAPDKSCTASTAPTGLSGSHRFHAPNRGDRASECNADDAQDTSASQSKGGDASNGDSAGGRLKVLRMVGGMLKLPKTIATRRRAGIGLRPLDEARLRRKVKKRAERADWDGVRSLLSNYEFPDIIDARAPSPSADRTNLLWEPNEAASIDFALPPPPARNRRRPSYGRRSSFTSSLRESTAASLAIAAASLQEDVPRTSGSSVATSAVEAVNAGNGGSDVAAAGEGGEGILHDVCHRQPPLDVVETLLKALRHRRRAHTTSSVDGFGRTPLHVAALAGASPDVVDALVQFDPRPASVGDAKGRSPLHLAVRYLVSNHRQGHNRGGSEGGGRRTSFVSGGSVPSIRKKDTDAFAPTSKQHHALTYESSYQVIRILKNTMLTYPGRVDFRDVDDAGFSPLDYAIDSGSIISGEDNTNQELLHVLMRRKDPLTKTKSVVMHRRNRRLTIRSSFSDDHQDIKVLQQLEQEEVEARRQRLERMKRRSYIESRRSMHDALFDVFGIDQSAVGHRPSLGTLEKSAVSSKKVPSVNNGDDGKVGCEKASDKDEQHLTPSAESDEDVFNKHLQAYLDDYMDDLDEAHEFFQHEEADGFDIYQDPDELQHPSASDEKEAKGPFPLLTIGTDDTDCDASMVSEISAPLSQTSR